MTKSKYLLRKFLYSDHEIVKFITRTGIFMFNNIDFVNSVYTLPGKIHTKCEPSNKSIYKKINEQVDLWEALVIS